MKEDYRQFEKRKQDHINLALMPVNQSSELNELDSISLTHEALPNLNFDDIDISTTRFNKKEPKPFIVSSMTAGHQGALDINRRLMDACTQSQWAMGVGSQRRELTDKEAFHEWAALRREFPYVNLYSNLGIAQIIHTSLGAIQSLVDVLQAKALIIHCNPLQECIQPEGTTHFRGSWEALENLAKVLSSPLIVKETGCGFSKESLRRLNNIGVAAVDVSGLGGTHWGRIEGHRAGHDAMRKRTAETFRNWGITTLQSVKDAAIMKPHFEIWGSGGVRHGLDAAKIFALGASTVGFAGPMLKAALHSPTEVVAQMDIIEYELKTAMFCTNSLVLSDLKEKICL